MIRRIMKDVRELVFAWGGLCLILLVAAGVVRVYPPVVLPEHPVLPLASGMDKNSVLNALGQCRYFYGMLDRIVIAIYYVGLTLIAVNLWGAEFKRSTIIRLLAQPISRWRLWREKAIAFGLIMVPVFAAMSVYGWQVFSFAQKVTLIESAVRSSMNMVPPCDVMPDVAAQFCSLLLLVSLVAWSSGLLVSLFMRETYTAFWGALILPILALMVGTFIDHYLILHFLHFSIFEKLESALPMINLCGSQYLKDCEMFSVLGLIWFVIVYPLAWRKFKRLEV